MTQDKFKKVLRDYAIGRGFKSPSEETLKGAWEEYRKMRKLGFLRGTLDLEAAEDFRRGMDSQTKEIPEETGDNPEWLLKIEALAQTFKELHYSFHFSDEDLSKLSAIINDNIAKHIYDHIFRNFPLVGTTAKKKGERK